MALNNERVQDVAKSLQILSEDLARLHRRIEAALTYNANQAIDWGAALTPVYINEDAGGNLTGLNFSRQQVANAIGSFDWVRKLLNNQSLAGGQGDHLGNLNLLASLANELSRG